MQVKRAKRSYLRSEVKIMFTSCNKMSESVQKCGKIRHLLWWHSNDSIAMHPVLIW